jgi:hypothetical protein
MAAHVGALGRGRPLGQSSLSTGSVIGLVMSVILRLSGGRNAGSTERVDVHQVPAVAERLVALLIPCRPGG